MHCEPLASSPSHLKEHYTHWVKGEAGFQASINRQLIEEANEKHWYLTKEGEELV